MLFHFSCNISSGSGFESGSFLPSAGTGSVEYWPGSATHGFLVTVPTISGGSPFLPTWQEDSIYPMATMVRHVPFRHTTHVNGRRFSYRFREVGNTRVFLVDLMENLLQKVLRDRSDDTKVMITISSILKLLVFQHSYTDESLDKHVKSFQQSRWETCGRAILWSFVDF